MEQAWDAPSQAQGDRPGGEFSFVGEETLYRTFFRSAMSGVLFTDAAEQVLDANAEACRLLGRGREELLAPDAGAVFDPSDPRLAAARQERKEKSSFRGPLRVMRGGDPAGFFEASVTVVGYVDGFGEDRLVIMVLDREETLPGVSPEAVESTEETYRSLAGYVGDVVAIFEADGVTRYASPSVERVLGFTPEELVGTVTLNLVHPDDLEMVVTNSAANYESPGVFPPYVYRLQRKDGSYAHVEAAMNNLLDDPGINAVVGVLRDVTERVRAEEEVKRLNHELERRVAERTAELEVSIARLKESERAIDASFEGASSGLARLTPDGRYSKVNKKFCEITGYAPAELLSMTPRQITHPEDARKDDERHRGLHAGALPGYSGEKRYLRKDGSYAWVSLNVSPSNEGGEPGHLLVAIEDVDARKKAELALGSLTTREKEVLALLARGRTNPQISEGLHISASTIRFHIQNVVEKLGVENRTGAAVRAIELGLLSDQ